MPSKEQVLIDIINENKKNINRLMKVFEGSYTEVVILWLNLNKN